jgi:hypothetical protein
MAATAGLYGLYWIYESFHEVQRHRGRGVGGFVGLLLSLVGVSSFLLPSYVGKMYEEDGKTSPISVWNGFWLFLPVVGWAVWVVRVQGALNVYWETRRSRGHQSELFFDRMRRQTRWVFAVLAVVFAGSFVFLGVGSGGSALTDFLNGNIHLFGSSSGPSVKSVEAKVAKDPTNPKLRLQLAQLLVTKNQVDDAIPAWKSYLKLKPGDTEGLLGLAGVYSTKITALTNEVQNPPTPPLANLNAFLPVSQTTVLGTALSGLQPPELSITSLQQGETDLLQKQLAGLITAHIGIYRTLAAKTPGDSSSFHEIEVIASQDGDLTAAIAIDQQFLKKFPTDPLIPDIKREIKTLEQSLASATSQTG